MTAEAWTAVGTWALVLVTIGAVVVGGLAAAAANRTLRLEAEPKLIVRIAREAHLFARGDEVRGLRPSWRGHPASAPTVDEAYTVSDPVYVLDGREGRDGLRIIVNGFDLRKPLASEVHRLHTETVPLWPAIRLEVRNLGRSPAIDVALHLSITGVLTAVNKSLALGDPIQTVTKTDEALITVDGVGPNDSAFVWLANKTGTPFTISIKSARQRDPFALTSGKSVEIPAIATSTFSVAGQLDNVPGIIAGGGS